MPMSCVGYGTKRDFNVEFREEARHIRDEVIIGTTAGTVPGLGEADQKICGRLRFRWCDHCKKWHPPKANGYLFADHEEECNKI